MKAMVILLVASLSIYFYTKTHFISSPFPHATYLGEHYRISGDEPKTHIKTKVTISSKEKVEQTLTLIDASLTNHAVFNFKGKISLCDEFVCLYSRIGKPLILAGMQQPLYQSKYLELLSKDKKIKSEIELMYKDKNFIIMFEKSGKRPYLYAIQSMD